MAPSLSVLFVEDDARLAQLTAEYLEAHGIRVTRASRGSEALAEVRRSSFDLVLLDLMLPDGNGFDVCRAIRVHSSVPILMLTARDEEIDRVMGLQLGADDYVVKPFSSRELVARVEALVRRARGQVGPAPTVVASAGLELDSRAFSAKVDGKPLQLTAYEFSLLRVLLENQGQVLTRERLMELAGKDTEEAFDRSIDVHMSRLRRKLGPRVRERLKTIRGAGYLFGEEG